MPETSVVGKVDDPGRRGWKPAAGVARIMCGEPCIDCGAEQLFGGHPDIFRDSIKLGSLIGRNDEQ